MNDEPNEVSIHLHAHNNANLQKAEKLHLEYKTTLIWNIDFQRVTGGFIFFEIFTKL